jgi:hypothetical protein
MEEKFSKYLEGKDQADLATVVEHFKAFLKEHFGDKITFLNSSSYTLNKKLLNLYLDKVLQKKSIAEDGKEGLIFETAYLDLSKIDNADYDWYPFFYIVRPITGYTARRLIFTDRDDFAGDWENAGVICENEEEIIKTFIAKIDEMIPVVESFTQLDFAHA